MSAIPDEAPEGAKPTRSVALRWLKRAALAVSGAVVLSAAAFVAWGLTPLGPSTVAMKALSPGDGVEVSEKPWGLSFSPSEGEAKAGLVLYPGGRVDFRSYAPLARDVARQGYLVAIVRVPLSLAILDQGAADAPLDEAAALPWAVGGHSLGGVAAADFAARDDRVDGLLLLASYPIVDLSDSELFVIDVTASRDGVLDQANWNAAYAKLPRDTARIVVDGGNHAQFGSYGEQPGDTPATVSEADQRGAVADVAAQMLARLAEQEAK